MNKVDNYIKQLMLGYPSLYPNRFAVMKHIFCSNGSGYSWDKNGCPVLFHQEKQFNKMDMKIEKELLKKYKKGYDDPHEAMSDFYLANVIQVKKVLSDYRWREKNIDLIASKMHPFVSYNDVYGLLYEHNGTYGWLLSIDNGDAHKNPNYMPQRDDIDKEWREALLGFIHEILPVMHSRCGYLDEENKCWKVTEFYKETDIGKLYVMLQDISRMLITDEQRKMAEKVYEMTKE